jgi:hypothetical protein
MTRILTTSKPQTPHGDPLIGSLCECIHLDAIGHVEFHLKHLESLVCRRLHRGTSTPDVDVPYLPGLQFGSCGDIVDPMLIGATHLLMS